MKTRGNVIYVDFSENRSMTLAEVKDYFNDQGQYEWAMDDATIGELEQTIREVAEFNFTLYQAYTIILRVRKHDLFDNDNVVKLARKRKRSRKQVA